MIPSVLSKSKSHNNKNATQRTNSGNQPKQMMPGLDKTRKMVASFASSSTVIVSSKKRLIFVIAVVQAIIYLTISWSGMNQIARTSRIRGASSDRSFAAASSPSSSFDKEEVEEEETYAIDQNAAITKIAEMEKDEEAAKKKTEDNAKRKPDQEQKQRAFEESKKRKEKEVSTKRKAKQKVGAKAKTPSEDEEEKNQEGEQQEFEKFERETEVLTIKKIALEEAKKKDTEKWEQDAAELLSKVTALRSTSASTSLLACEWKPSPLNLEECKQFLTPYLLNPIKHHWYFIGDSTMRYMFHELQSQLNQTFIAYQAQGTQQQPLSARVPHVIKVSRGSCRGLEYFGFRRSTKWMAPNRSLGEGPKTWKRPYCTECTNSNTKVEVDYGIVRNATTATHETTIRTSILDPLGNKFQFELVTVEYALDVEMPTQATRTTQETLAMYLELENRQHQRHNDTVCVVNTGIHDVKLVPNMTPELFATNVKQYLELIHPHCGTLIWMGISAVKTNPRVQWAQRNDVLVQLDDEVNRLLDRFNSEHHTNTTKDKTRRRTKDSMTERGIGYDSSSHLSGVHVDHDAPFRPILRIDVWNKSLTSPHRDHVHLDPASYYNPLASLFANFIRPSR